MYTSGTSDIVKLLGLQNKITNPHNFCILYANNIYLGALQYPFRLVTRTNKHLINFVTIGPILNSKGSPTLAGISLELNFSGPNDNTETASTRILHAR